MPEVVEGGDLSREAEHRVGHALVVGRHRRQPFDLAHGVVAEPADDAAVEGRELRDLRRADTREQRLDRGEAARVGRHARGRLAVEELDAVTAHDQRRARDHDRRTRSVPTARACSTDSSRKPSPSPTSLMKAESGVSRSASTSRQIGTTEYSPASATNSSSEACDADSLAHTEPGVAPLAELAEEARPLTRVAGARALLLDDEEQRVHVAVVRGAPDVLPVARGFALAPQLLPAATPEPGAAGLERLAERLAVHPRATSAPRRSPLPARSRPRGPIASNFTASSSASVNGTGVVTGAAGMRGSVVRARVSGRARFARRA